MLQMIGTLTSLPNLLGAQSIRLQPSRSPLLEQKKQLAITSHRHANFAVNNFRTPNNLESHPIGLGTSVTIFRTLNYLESHPLRNESAPNRRIFPKFYFENFYQNREKCKFYKNVTTYQTLYMKTQLLLRQYLAEFSLK